MGVNIYSTAVTTIKMAACIVILIITITIPDITNNTIYTTYLFWTKMSFYNIFVSYKSSIFQNFLKSHCSSYFSDFLATSMCFILVKCVRFEANWTTWYLIFIYRFSNLKFVQSVSDFSMVAKEFCNRGRGLSEETASHSSITNFLNGCLNKKWANLGF